MNLYSITEGKKLNLANKIWNPYICSNCVSVGVCGGGCGAYKVSLIPYPYLICYSRILSGTEGTQINPLDSL
jgi:hypothetical protein